MYSLDTEIKNFAVTNEFVKITSDVCYKLGTILKPFSIYAQSDKQIDFATFKGIVNPNQFITDEIANIRRNKFPGASTKYLFIDYLLSASICYVEIPKFITKDGIATHSYDKFLCTRNPAIIRQWLGTSIEDTWTKYASKLIISPENIATNEIPIIKLNTSGKGNTVTVPRKSLKLDKLVCIPLYMINSFCEGFKTRLNAELLEFTYLKDNDTERKLVTTLNPDILKQVYSAEFIGKIFANIDVAGNKQGDMYLPTKIGRGYIKVPEVGLPRFDESGVRSLNLIRLLEIKPITLDEVDLSCINVNLNTVQGNFVSGIEHLAGVSKEELLVLYRKLTDDTTELTHEIQAAVLVEKIKQFIDQRIIIFSTTYLRTLHKFMVENPQWFSTTSDVVSTEVKSSVNFGVVEDFVF